MSPAKSDGQIWIEKAEKKANSSPGLFGSESAIYGEAAELYRKAGNEFKVGSSHLDAGTAFSREAECWEKCGESFDAASAWRNAANAYKQVDELERKFFAACPSKLENHAEADVPLQSPLMHLAKRLRI